MSVTKTFRIYTDGSCAPTNPGPGGWAALIESDGHQNMVSGHEPYSTNNRMELAAVRGGLHKIPSGSHVVIITDSQNVIGWLSRGWRRMDRTIAALCEEIDSIILQSALTVSFEKVSGHSGDPLNEQVHQTAYDEAILAGNEMAA